MNRTAVRIILSSNLLREHSLSPLSLSPPSLSLSTLSLFSVSLLPLSRSLSRFLAKKDLIAVFVVLLIAPVTVRYSYLRRPVCLFWARGCWYVFHKVTEPHVIIGLMVNTYNQHICFSFMALLFLWGGRVVLLAFLFLFILAVYGIWDCPKDGRMCL